MIDTIEFLIKTGICSSKREAKELCKSGAIRINTVKVDREFKLKL